MRCSTCVTAITRDQRGRGTVSDDADRVILLEYDLLHGLVYGVSSDVKWRPAADTTTAASKWINYRHRDGSSVCLCSCLITRRP